MDSCWEDRPACGRRKMCQEGHGASRKSQTNSYIEEGAGSLAAQSISGV